jgi:K+-sensing histidine kinase KdpD
MAQTPDSFEADHLLNAIVATLAVSFGLVFVPTPVAVPALVVLAFFCGRLGGRDGGLGSVVTGSLMYGWAITEPHFRWEIRNDRDVVLLFVLFFGSLLASEIGTRLRFRTLTHRR